MKGDESVTYIPYRESKRNTAWFAELENRFQSFLDSGNWLYNFENEYLQSKKQDIEARYLSHYFFSKLINRMNNTYIVEITDSTYMHVVYKDKRTQFHFDVMHNPKECHAFWKSSKIVHCINGLYGRVFVIL